MFLVIDSHTHSPVLFLEILIFVKTDTTTSIEWVISEHLLIGIRAPYWSWNTSRHIDDDSNIERCIARWWYRDDQRVIMTWYENIENIGSENHVFSDDIDVLYLLDCSFDLIIKIYQILNLKMYFLKSYFFSFWICIRINTL